MTSKKMEDLIKRMIGTKWGVKEGKGRWEGKIIAKCKMSTHKLICYTTNCK